MPRLQHKMQIAVYDRIIAEVIGDYDYLSKLWIRWCNLRYSRNEPLGCSAIYLADMSSIL